MSIIQKQATLPGLDSVHSLLDYPERLTPRAEVHGRYEDVYCRYRQVVDAVLTLWHPEAQRQAVKGRAP